jgi:hypothetical protein
MADNSAAFERSVCQKSMELKAPAYQLWVISLLSRNIGIRVLVNDLFIFLSGGEVFAEKL